MEIGDRSSAKAQSEFVLVLAIWHSEIEIENSNK